VDMQSSLAGWIEAVADSWLADQDTAQGDEGGHLPPQVQRDVDDAELARELAGFVRDLSDSDPDSAVLLEEIGALETGGWATNGSAAERLRKQLVVLRRQLNTAEAKHQTVETVVRSLFAESQG
jgi:hypothetical protein